jgi:hypothetical protein
MAPRVAAIKVQRFGAIEIRFQCPFNGLDLSGDTFNALE